MLELSMIYNMMGILFVGNNREMYMWTRIHKDLGEQELNIDYFRIYNRH